MVYEHAGEHPSEWAAITSIVNGPTYDSLSSFGDQQLDTTSGE